MGAVVHADRIEFENRTSPLRAITVVELKSCAGWGVILAIAVWYFGLGSHRINLTEDWEKTVVVFSLIGAMALLFAGKVVVRADGKKYVVDRGWIRPMSKLKDSIASGLV